MVIDHADGQTQEELLEFLSNQRSNNIESTTESQIFREQLSEILQSEVEKLAPLYKTLITLYHQEELSYEEISQITSLPMGTVKNYLFRARKALKNRVLQKYNKEEL